MPSSNVVDVAVGLLFLYALLSAASSTLLELVSSVLSWRARDLEAGIRVTLGSEKTWDLLSWLRWLLRGGGFAAKDDKTTAMVDRVLGHELVGGALPTRRNLPSYVSPRNFALAVFDVATDTVPVSLASVVEALRRPGQVPEPIRHALQPLVDTADTLDKARDNVAHWFDAQMDRLSGLYRRRSQVWLVVFGVGISSAMNLDTFEIAKNLATDAAASAAVVAMAQGSSANRTVVASAQVGDGVERSRKDYERVVADVRDLTSTGLAVGWSDRPICSESDHGCAGPWGRKALGILITALTTVMGASTWFSALGKLLSLRSSVKPQREPA
jgi:hypothetical protein